MRNETGQVTCYAVQKWTSMTSSKKDSAWYDMNLFAVLGEPRNPKDFMSYRDMPIKLRKLLNEYEDSFHTTYMSWGHRATTDEKLARRVLAACRKDKPKFKWRLVQKDIAIFTKQVA